MEQSVFININLLSEEAKSELAAFYEFLIFKYKIIPLQKREKKSGQFDKFLSTSIKVDHFQSLTREERNER